MYLFQSKFICKKIEPMPSLCTNKMSLLFFCQKVQTKCGLNVLQKFRNRSVRSREAG